MSFPKRASKQTYDVHTYRNNVNIQQALINSLHSQLEEKEAEYQRLREELQQVSNQPRNVIYLDADEEVEKLKKREESLQGMLEEKEGMIAGLQKRIVKGSERDLEMFLAEAESKVEEKDRQLQRSETYVDAREPPNENGLNIKAGRKSGRLVRDKDWELRCTKGIKRSSYIVAWDLARRSLA